MSLGPSIPRICHRDLQGIGHDSVKKRQPLLTVGWRELVDLPDLGIHQIRGKIDTGARTSALHAIRIREYFHEGVLRVRFQVHPIQRDTSVTLTARATVIDEREVRSSNGKSELRPVIETSLLLGGQRWPIELTLTSREQMGFHLLLGRQALRGHALVHPGRSFLTNTQPRGNP